MTKLYTSGTVQVKSINSKTACFKLLKDSKLCLVPRENPRRPRGFVPLLPLRTQGSSLSTPWVDQDSSSTR